jgi:hypothetical protein
MCAVLCAWVIASSKVVRRPWTGIWYTSLFAPTRGPSHSTLTSCVKLFVCRFVCLLSPSIQLCCLSVAARRIQVRKIRDMRRIHRLRRLTTLSHTHPSLCSARFSQLHLAAAAIHTTCSATRVRTKWGVGSWRYFFFPLVIITQCPLLICIECWV